MLLVWLLLVWLAFSAGFLAGAAWVNRRPEPPRPQPPPVRIVRAFARPDTLVWRMAELPGDVVPHREEYDEADRAVLDELEPHKW